MLFFKKSENKYAPCFFLFLCMFVMDFTSLKLMIIVIIHLYTFLIFSSAFYIWITLNLLYSLLVGFSLCVCVVGIFEFYKHVFIVSIHNHYICKLNNLDRLNIGSWTKFNLSNCLCRFIRKPWQPKSANRLLQIKWQYDKGLKSSITM